MLVLHKTRKILGFNFIPCGRFDRLFFDLSKFWRVFGDSGESWDFNCGTIDGVVVGISRHSHKVNRCIMKICGLVRMRFGDWCIKIARHLTFS